MSSACEAKQAFELCFNALDDNCNGRIDEGCGEGAGPLQIVLAWSPADQDLDLSVTPPDGAIVSKGARRPVSGLLFGRDCPAEECSGQNVEEVYAEDAASVAAGLYVVKIRSATAAAIKGANSATLGIRVGTSVFRIDLSKIALAADIELSFDVSSAP